MKKLLILLLLFISTQTFSQVSVETKSKLQINHGDITLTLDEDTNTFVSIHKIKYANILNIGKYDRCNCWFQDTYDMPGKKSIYKKVLFKGTGYDLGHLTPSSASSYDSVSNRNSFSMFNEAPQVAFFNEHPWEQLEMHVQDTIKNKYKSDVIITTGVLYDNTKKTYLPSSRIKIPVLYYKILWIQSKNITYVWYGLNVDDKTKSVIQPTTISNLDRKS